MLRGLNALAVAIAFGMLSIFSVMLWIDREDTLARAAAVAANLREVLANDIGRTIRGYDLSIDGVIEGLAQPDLDTLPPHIVHRLLFDRAASAEHLGSLLVLGPGGDIAYDSSSVQPRRGNFADRDYFTAHRDSPYVGLYVSVPFASRLQGGELAIALSRRLNDADGRFAGIVVGTLRVSYLRELLHRVELGRQGSITLYRDDGRVLMRAPFVDDMLGRDLTDSPNVRRFVDHGESSFMGRAAIDGVQRLYSFGRVPGVPAFMSVNLAPDEFLAPWRQRTVGAGTVTLALIAAVLALSVLFQRELRRREGVERQLAVQAQTDGLTGLPNRRAFDLTLAGSWQSAAAAGQPVTLLFVDVDHFKPYNDRYGHLAGDAVLRRVGKTLRQTVRPGDFAARYGGEEFVVLLPGTGEAVAHELADRLRARIRALQIANAGAPGGICTVSVGLASVVASDAGDPAVLVAGADAALYRAKAGGRDRVAA